MAHTLASWGITLQASEPLAMVKAAVVRSMAAAWGETRGMTAFSRGANSHRFPNRSRRGKEA